MTTEKKIEAVARLLCRESGGDPDCLVIHYFHPYIMDTPRGKVQSIPQPAAEPYLLWQDWIQSAKEVIKLMEEINDN